jgi:aminopeptidase N
MAAYSQLPPIQPGVSHDLAIWRAAHYSDVRYKLNLTLEKMSPVLKGSIEIRVQHSFIVQTEPIPLYLVLDWRKIRGYEKSSTISNVRINGYPVAQAEQGSIAPGRQLFIVRSLKATDLKFYEQNEHLVFSDGVQMGENVITLDFTSPILTSGSAITRYIDKEDGSEYIYSLFVPSDASTAFPVFDQPDLKARFSLSLTVPEGWKAVSNTAGQTYVSKSYDLTRRIETVQASTEFRETKPISSYVFAFAAGPWSVFDENDVPPPPAVQKSVAGEGVTNAAQKNTLPTGRVSASAAEALITHIYVRKSQAAKFQPHAAEVFKLTREGIKYLETYFDYEFPWPKYDIVLIPEFPFGGMEHAGATFLSERGVIFPSEPTANDYISRANLIFHETAHQWFGDTVTMKWFDDLWLKEGFAEFMAYKTLEHVMPQYNAWKAFYERNKQAAYLTDSTKGTTPIYQPIENLSSAKSAYGNIVYRKAPSFLRQAEFYLGPDKFQTAVRAFLKKHQYANATWQDLVSEFGEAAWPPKYGFFGAMTEERENRLKLGLKKRVSKWAEFFVNETGVPVIKVGLTEGHYERQIPSEPGTWMSVSGNAPALGLTVPDRFENSAWSLETKTLYRYDTESVVTDTTISGNPWTEELPKLFDKDKKFNPDHPWPDLIFPNYGDYGYGIFLLDDKSRDYVLKNIQNEKDDFLRSMMWGSLWDSVREAELDPREYVELAIKNLPTEKDETITASVLNRVNTAMTYYMEAEPPASAGGRTPASSRVQASPLANASGSALASRLEALLIDRMRTAPTLGQRITYYRAFLNIVSTESGRNVLKEMLRRSLSVPPAVAGGAVKTPPTTVGGTDTAAIPLKTKDRFDIVTRLAILGDPDAPKLLSDLEKTETSDDAKRYAYAAHAAFATKENREKFWNDFVNNKDISESWIEAAMGPFNSPKHSDLSLPYLQRALAELPNLKRNRKIFFVNGWLGAFIGGQKSQEALDIVNKFLADNPNLDKDLRLKILENVDTIERAVKIRNKYSQNHLR